MKSIYLIENTINGKVYVGQTKRKVHVRFFEHRLEIGSPLYYAMQEFGIDKFTYKILHICNDQYSDEWEHYYICKYNSTNKEFGYNRIDTARFIWKKGDPHWAKTIEGKKRISENNKRNLDRVTRGFKNYNNSRKFPVNMLDENGNVLKTFDSLLDACKFLNKPSCGTTRIKNTCDKFNKNGKRARFFGYSWSSVNKGVQTNCKTDDELPSE